MKTSRPKSHTTSALSFIAIILLVWYALTSQTPDALIESTQPATQWSSSRALEHVKIMSMQPHHIGNDAHDQVRDYIIEQLQSYGVQSTIQRGYTIDQSGNLAQPENIIARIPGSQNNNKAVLLLSHYDSDPHSSTGASDAASGVATILEGVRALINQNQQPLNDIIICITDAEELGLNGAQLFVNQHPWAKDVGIVLNFEARGSGGPSYMLLETNGGNRKLIEQFTNAGVSHPVTNSLAYSIYQMIPNNTDLTVFKQDGDINGYNFAFIGDHYDYHTQLDTYERLDRNTLAHQGSYLMPLLNNLSNIDLSDGLQTDAGDDLVYIPLPIVDLVTFPFSILPYIIIISGILLLVLLSCGFKKKRIKITHLLQGFIPLLASLIIGFLWCYFGWDAIKNGDFYIDQLHGFPYNGYWLIAVAAMSSMTFCLFLYHKFYHQDRIASLSVAPLILLWLICLLIAFPVGDGGLIPGVFLPGAGFLLIPLCAGLIQLWLTINQQRPSYVIMILLSVPLLFIITPFIKAFPVALGMKILFVASLLTVLLIGLLTPILGHYRRKDILAFFGLIATIVCVVNAFAKAEFNTNQPQSTSLVYLQNQDLNIAQWATYDQVLTDWTKQKLGNQPHQADSINHNLIDSKYHTKFSYTQPAIYYPLDTMHVDVLSDSINDQQRTVYIKVHSDSPLQRIEVFCDSSYQFTNAIVNGKQAYIDPKSQSALPYRSGNRMISYYLSHNEPLELELTFNNNNQPIIEFYGATYDLLKQPQLKVKPRPIDQISKPFVLNDAVIRYRKLTLNRPKIQSDTTHTNE